MGIREGRQWNGNEWWQAAAWQGHQLTALHQQVTPMQPKAPCAIRMNIRSLGLQVTPDSSAIWAKQLPAIVWVQRGYGISQTRPRRHRIQHTLFPIKPLTDAAPVMLPVATLQLAGGLHIQKGDLQTREGHQEPAKGHAWSR
jgi:hypothetical protein